MCETSSNAEIREIDTATADGDEWGEHTTPQGAIPRPAQAMAEAGTIFHGPRRAAQVHMQAVGAEAAAVGAQALRPRSAGGTPSPSTAKHHKTGDGGGAR